MSSPLGPASEPESATAVFTEPPSTAQDTLSEKPRSLWRMGFEVFAQNRLALTGLIIVILMTLFCFVGPLLYHTDQVHTNLAEANLPPSGSHLLGTSDVGYDQLGRLMAGGKISIEVGLAAAALATVIGTLWGAIAGYIGGVVDGFLMRIVDALLAIPALFLLLVISAIFNPTKGLLILVLGLTAWLVPARLVRGEALSLRNREYVQAVRLMGGKGTRAVLRHIAPNAVGTIIVNATFQIADAILAVAYLSFLGLGIPPPAADWGGMLSSGINYTYSGYWWLIYPPGIAIILIVVAFNFIGDGLRDAFEVRLQRR